MVEPLRSGRLCITSIVELAKVMTPENRAEVLPRFFHASKQEARAAELAPREAAPHRSTVTAVTPRSSQPVASLAAALSPSLELGQTFHPDETPPPQARVAAAPPPPPAPAPRTSAEPLTAELRRLHVTVSKRFLEKLEVARAALSHSHAGADAEAILEAGLDLLIARSAKRKGIVERPRTPRGPLSPALPAVARDTEAAKPRADDADVRSRDRIPAAVRREVWIRDGGRCQWPLDGGGVCGSTLRVELDHILPLARGGASTIENLRLCCRMHNQLAARRAFGDAWMDRFTRDPHSADRGAAGPTHSPSISSS